MRDLIIDMADFGGVASAGDEVVLSAPAVRGSSVDPGRLITPQPRALELADGVATVPVEVGPLRVTLKPRGGVLSGTTFETVVPEGEGPITLRLCLEGQFRYAPPVVSAVGEAAVRAEQSAGDAGDAADRAEAVADRVGSAEQVGVWAGEAVASAGDARDAADRAEAAETSAHSAAGSAASATTALIRDEMDAKVTEAAGAAAEEISALIRDEMDAKITEADGHAQSAGQSATLAGTHAEATGADRRQTGLDRQATGEDVIAVASLLEDMITGIDFIVTETAPGSGLYTIGGTQ